jgi:hypothetical protein
MSDVLPFGRLWYGGPNAVSNAIGYAMHYSRSAVAVIRVYDDAGNVIETHEHKGDFNQSPYLLFGADSFGALDASFWKRGSFRSESNIGSSRSSAGVSGTFSGNAPAYGVESGFRRRNARRQSRSFARWFAKIVSDDFPVLHATDSARFSLHTATTK